MNQVLSEVLGTSEVFLQFEEHLGLLAKTDRPVLVCGERGTGKELAVQRLHYRSGRWEKPFVTVLCPALSPALLESELFGHEAGAFTGARGRRAGYLERAHGGTLFLDEVADMPLSLQNKLLRVIEYGEFERVGGSAVVKVDVRVVAATNGNLPKLAQEGSFRADLLDRLAFDVLHVPPLRHRGEDKLLLASFFAAGMAAELGLLDSLREETQNEHKLEAKNRSFSPAFGAKAIAQLETYSWPGNIRELKNVVERSVARHRSLQIDSLDINPFAPLDDNNMFLPAALPSEATSLGQVMPAKYSIHHLDAYATEEASSIGGGFCLHFHHCLPENFHLHDSVSALEIAAIKAALEQSKHRQTVAARLLGLSYHQFRAMLKKYGKLCDKECEGL